MQNTTGKSNPAVMNTARIILPILKRHNITSASIFGSFARGEDDKGSDLDLLVEFSGRIGLLGVMKVKFELEEAIGKTVDLTSRDALHPAIRKNVLQEQIRIL
ncbi:MAG: nucleotidyltransferase family protein [Gemmatimonadota bacterium]|nr:nucleotidyltransferase family protein [Gemmatimonadota bacterium]